MIVVAFSMLALTGMAAIAIDASVGYNERRATQNAADNAALAAAWAGCHGEDPVSAATEVAVANSMDPTSPNILVDVIPEGDGLFRVTISTTRDTRFAPVLGVNEMAVVSEAVASCEAIAGTGPYALFTGSPPGACGGFDMELSSGSTTVNGSLHTNDTLNSNGSQTITGFSTYVTPLPQWQLDAFADKFVGGHGLSPILAYPVPSYWSHDNYAPGGSQANAAGSDYYYHVPTGLSLAANTLLPGLHYFDGNANIYPGPGGAVSLLNTTIVAKGTLTISASITNASAFEEDGLLYFAAGGGCGNGLQISVSNGVMDGVIFVPNGKAQVNTSHMTINGSIIGYTMNLAGGNNTINAVGSGGGPTQFVLELEE